MGIGRHREQQGRDPKARSLPGVFENRKDAPEAGWVNSGGRAQRNDGLQVCRACEPLSGPRGASVRF